MWLAKPGLRTSLVRLCPGLQAGRSKRAMKDYEVGYKKPAKRGQFKRGTSGNPGGRPKGRRNLATVLQASLNETTVIVEDGHKRTVSKLQAIVKRLVDSATTGELPAIRLLSALTLSPEDSLKPPESISDLAQEDQKMLARLA